MNMLTLRYDPNKKTVRESLSSEDFIPLYYDDIESNIIKIVENDLLQKQENLKFEKVSVALSGGIDSGFTLAMLRSILPDIKIHCVSVGFGDVDDEVKRAEELAQIYDCDFYGMFIENIFTDLPKLISIVKEPRWNLYQYYPIEYGKRNSNVFYSGDGGDEIFAGYTFRYNKFLSLLKPSSTWIDKAEIYLSCHDRDWVPNQTELFGASINFSWEKIYHIFKYSFNNSLSPLDQVFLSDFNGKLLYDWLPVNKAFGEELDIHIGSVFLTDAMIKFATHIPWYKKYDNNMITGKLPIRSILHNQRGFEQLKPLKKGFSLDLLSLWNKSARDIVNTYINDDCEIVKDGVIKKEWIISAKERLSSTNAQFDKSRYISKMFSLLALEIFYKLFVSRTLKENQKL